MANWIVNKLRCSKGDIKEIVDHLDGGEGQRVDFNAINPVPDIDEFEQWRKIVLEKWGSLSNAFEIKIENDEIEFITKWYVPWVFWKGLSERFPDHTLELIWLDSSYGFEGCGTATLTKGEIMKYEKSCDAWEIKN
jgi:hypothetical protein